MHIGAPLLLSILASSCLASAAVTIEEAELLERPLLRLFDLSDGFLKASSSTKCPPHPTTTRFAMNDLGPSTSPAIAEAIQNVSAIAKSTLSGSSASVMMITVTFDGKRWLSKGFQDETKRNDIDTKGSPTQYFKGVPDEDTVFRVASVTKLFTTLMTASAVDNGLLTWDQPLQDLNPDFSILPPFSMDYQYGLDSNNNDATTSPKTTLSQLLSHQAGLPRESPCRPRSGTTSLCPQTTKEILSDLSRWNLISLPWRRPSYSNLGFSLMGNLVAEKISSSSSSTFSSSSSSLSEKSKLHESRSKHTVRVRTSNHVSIAESGIKKLRDKVSAYAYPAVMSERVFSPLNMTSSGFDFPASIQSRMPPGYLTAGGSPMPIFEMGWNLPCGGMRTTARDLNNALDAFVSAWNGKGESMDPASINSNNVNANMESMISASLFPKQDTLRKLSLPARWINPDLSTGIGTPFELHFVNGYSVRSKAGNIEGWSSSVAFVPELSLSVVALWNGGMNSNEFSKTAFESLIPAMEAALQQNAPPIARNPPNTGMFVGAYSLVPGSGRFMAKVIANPQYNALTLVFLNTGVLLDFVGYDSNNTKAIFRVAIPEGLIGCLAFELQAFDGQIVTFDVQDDAVKSFEVQGIIPGAIYIKE